MADSFPTAAEPTDARIDARHVLAGQPVLLVEPDPAARTALAQALAACRMKVDACADVGQALQALAARPAGAPYRFALLARDAGGMDGATLGEALRADARHAGVRLVLLAEDEAAVARGMAPDFLAVVARPAGPDAVLAALAAGAAADDTDEAAAGPGEELDAVRNMFGDAFPELAQMYLRDAPGRIAALHAAGAAGDLAAMARVAHAFGGSCASMGATRLSRMCKQLEIDSKAGAIDRPDRRVDEIEAEYLRIAGKLAAMTGSH